MLKDTMKCEYILMYVIYDVCDMMYVIYEYFFKLFLFYILHKIFYTYIKH